MLKYGMSAAVLAMSAISAPAAAQSSQGLTVDAIGEVLGDHVDSLERKSNDDGELYFTASMTGANEGEYGIVAVPFECTGAVPRCMGVTLYANFDWGGEIDAASLSKLSHYNDTHRRGRSYSFANTVGVDYQVYLGDGAGEQYLHARVAEFGKVLGDFVVHMNK